jgi:hypothetical protein
MLSASSRLGSSKLNKHPLLKYWGSCMLKYTPRQVLGLGLRIGRTHQAQNTTRISLFADLTEQKISGANLRRCEKEDVLSLDISVDHPVVVLEHSQIYITQSSMYAANPLCTLLTLYVRC